MAISSLLGIAQRALLANETALGVVGNNIANVNTPGYTREVPDLESDPSIVSPQGVLIGTGVHVAAVRQVIDPLLEKRLLGAETSRREQGALRDQLSALAGALNELDQPSLGDSVNGFFDAADALARNPSGTAERETLLGRARALADELQRRSGVVATLQRGADDAYVAATTRANDALAQIADLNRAITAAEAGGQRANDLRDRRRTAVADLAGVVGVQTVETADGALTVSAANGAVLVDGGGVVHQLAVRKQVVGLDGQALHEAGLADRSGNFIAVPGTVAHGELAALARVRDSDLVGASGQLDGFASAIITEVNRVQTNGGAGAVDLDGGSTAAVPLFGGTDAKTITVLLTGADAGRRIGAALSAEPGDNQNALALADLRTTAQGALGATTFSGFLAGLTGQVGESAAQARDGAQAAEALQQQLHNQRESFSGVNLNEELTNLLRYQRAFQASAEAINVGNQVLDELMQLVR